MLYPSLAREMPRALQHLLAREEQTDIATLPRRSFLKRPGTITVRFLPPIAPGLGREAALKRLEGELEAETDRLVVAAGGPASAHAAGGAPTPGVEAAG